MNSSIKHILNTSQLEWGSFISISLQGLIPYLEFTIEIQPNSPRIKRQSLSCQNQ